MSDAPALPTVCALCGEDEPLTWVDLRGSFDKLRRIAVCGSCYVDLRVSDADVEDADE